MSDDQPIKRGPGRPRKNPLPEQEAPIEVAVELTSDAEQGGYLIEHSCGRCHYQESEVCFSFTPRICAKCLLKMSFRQKGQVDG